MVNFLRRFRIGSRLAFTYALLLLLFAGFGALSLAHLSSLNRHIDNIVLDRMVKTQHMNTMIRNSLDASVLIRNLVLETDPQARSDMYAVLVEEKREYEESHRTIERMPNSREGLDVLATIEARRQEAMAYNEKI